MLCNSSCTNWLIRWPGSRSVGVARRQNYIGCARAASDGNIARSTVWLISRNTKKLIGPSEDSTVRNETTVSRWPNDVQLFEENLNEFTIFFLI